MLPFWGDNMSTDQQVGVLEFLVMNRSLTIQECGCAAETCYK